MSDEPFDAMNAFSSSNGPCGVLVLHGFTGSPASMRPLAEAFANDGFSVELPLLPGHGTSVEDLAGTTFSDWTDAVQTTLDELRVRSDHLVVVGHSMGGALALWLAERNSDLAGLILINPMAAPPAASFLQIMTGALASGVTSIPSIGGDIKRGPAKTGGYNATPIAPLLSLCEATTDIAARLGEIICPTLLISSKEDHVVPTESSDMVEQQIGGPIERVILENSFHIATLDNDAAEVEERSVAFAAKVCVS